MKAKILLSIICACFLFKAQAQKQEWEWVCSLFDGGLCKVYAQGADTVYVVGENGLVAKSPDKGITWDKSYLTDMVHTTGGNGQRTTLNDIIFCNHDVGFIVGAMGTIFRTQDAGFSWEQMASGTDENINAIAAFDLDNIWAVGTNSVIVNSIDRGETWITKPLLYDNWYLLDLKCKGDKGYITGQGGIVLNTENGGRTWEEQVLTGYREYDEIRSLSITDSKVYAWGKDGIFFTENNINWHTLGGWDFIGNSSIYFQDGQKSFAASYDYTTCGDCGVIFEIHETIDNGNTWEETYHNFFNGYASAGNFAFSPNNEFGYSVMGKYLVRTPYTGEFSNCKNVGINVIQSENQLTISQIGKNKLFVKSESKPIKSVSMFNISGIKVSATNWTNSAEEYSFEIGSLPQGVYLIKVILNDNGMLVYKWIKQ
jgi:Uncharacterized protein related to plant photosystem II stability/assembly factor